MTLREKLDADMKQAMRSRDSLRLLTIRGIRGAVRNKEIEVGDGTTVIQAAEELFGVESIQVQKTVEAFDAVEIFDGGGTPDPPDFPGIDGDDATLYVRTDPSFPGVVEFLERRETALGDPVGGAYLSSGDVASKRSSEGRWS